VFPSDHPVFVSGVNNQGKSNFLEALYFLGCLRSPRTLSFSHLVREGYSQAVIGGDIENGDKIDRCYARLDLPGNQLSVLKNSQPLKGVGAYRKMGDCYYLSAEVIRFFLESPEFRRRVLNDHIGKYDSGFKSKQRRLDQVVRQKNRLLKIQGSKNNIRLWNEQIVREGPSVVAARMRAIDRLNIRLGDLIDRFDSRFKSAKLVYRFKRMTVSDFSEEFYAEVLEKTLGEQLGDEILRGRSSVGPHLDDVELLIFNKPIQYYFSKGVNRALAFLLQLAMIEEISEDSGKTPVVLMDETFAEIHFDMRQKLIALIPSSYQQFYASVEERDSGLFEEKLTLNVVDGSILVHE